MLLITHDLLAVLPVADRLAVLLDGRLQGIDSAEAFEGDGRALGSAHARDLWRALPQNGFLADA